MIQLKTSEEIAFIRKSSLLVGKTLAAVAREVRPGVSTLMLDQVAETFIRDHGGIPAFKGFEGFTGTLCVSVNSQVVHGIPGEYELLDGDIISIDCGVVLDGWYGDSAYTIPVGEVKPEVLQLLRVTKECLYKGIEKVVAGGRLGDVSATIQEHAEKHGYGVVRELVGHGIGRRLHEPPEVPNYGRRGSGPKMSEGLVIAIEPMINMGTKSVRHERDGWTITTADGKPSAHFEHTVAIQQGKAEILSSFDEIEEIMKLQQIEL
jgi:methionyl aminopeptidase